MTTTSPVALMPRKTPRQVRSTATVAAIFQATVQVLLIDGAARLTTTRVAERAGVSVGTMYQYFPHKQALLYAVLEQHLETVATAVETACRSLKGQPLAAISDGLVNAYLDAKTGHIEASRALYAISTEMDTADLVDGMLRRMSATIGALLACTRDTTFAELDSVTFTLQAVLAGTVRSVLERDVTPASLTMLRTELPRLCQAYLSVASSPP